MTKAPPRAGDIMNRKPILLRVDQLVRDAAELMWKKASPVAVVVDDERRPLGILSQQGLMQALLDSVNHGMPAGPLRQYLDPGLQRIDENAGPVRMAELFVREGYSVRALLVVRGERLVGLVLRRDVVHAVMDYLQGVEDHQQGTLYLSALREVDETPDFE